MPKRVPLPKHMGPMSIASVTHSGVHSLTVGAESCLSFTFADKDWAAKLPGGLIRWLCHDRGDEGVLVKENALRRVYRVDGPAETYYVKQHLRRGLAARIKDFVFGSPAKIEFKASAYASAHGVPAVRIVARAERLDSWQPHMSLSISPAIAESVPLSGAFLEANNSLDKNREAIGDLVEGVARLLAKAHDAGFLHRDSHPGNILVRRSETGGCDCAYVDVYGARCGREVTDVEAARNLAALNQWFVDRASRTCRLGFLRRYLVLRRGNVSREEIKTFTRLVLAIAERHAHALYRKRDRRIGGDNAYYTRLRLRGNRRAAITLRYRNLSTLLPVDLPELTREESVEDVKKRMGIRDASDGRETVRVEADEECFFPGGWWTGLVWWIAGSPAWRRYRTTNTAVNRDLPTVGARACMTGRRGLGVAWAVWWMAGPTGGEPLAQWLARNRSSAARRRVLERLGHLLADTCAGGLAIRNLAVARIGVVRGTDGEHRVYWQGIEGVALRGPAPRHVRDWMLCELARDVRHHEGLRALDTSRVVRAFCRRLGQRWKDSARRIAIGDSSLIGARE